VHTQWTVHYTRSRPGDYIRHVLTDDERNIVKAAVERGIVRAVAGAKIDDLLKQSASDQASVAVRAQEVAQETLDEIHSGIKLDKLTLLQKVPPFAVYSKFSSVQSAEQSASQKRDQAQTQARNTLNAMAGAAHVPLIEQIDLYEQAVNKGDTAAQEKTLAVINDIFLGKEVAMGDKVIPARMVSGDVTRIINDAKQYSSSIAEQRRGELAAFRAKLAQFKANPDLVVYREWADAMSQFLDKPIVESFRVPAGMDVLELWLGRDPSFLKDADKARKEALIKIEDEKRRQEQEQSRFQTRTDVKLLPSQ
jgi:regulator of protease activity HflC (stomatin/prohibitin superfamily)